MIERIYGQLGTPVEHGEPRPPEGRGRLAVQFDRAALAGTITVRRPGRDTADEIAQARRDLCEVAGAEVVYLELPLAQPATPALCRAAERGGFFFAGVGPCFAPDGDTLRLQFLNAPLDTSLLQLLSPFARELQTYIDAERARVTG
jgi:hypothetical protein